MKDRRLLIRWTLFVIVAALLVWRMVVLNFAEHYAASDPDRALHWYSTHPQALYEHARLTLDQDPAQAEHLLQQALQANPTDGRIYMTLARLALSRDNRQQAVRQAMLANELAPMRGIVQLEAAVFWSQLNWLERALQHWRLTLELLPELRTSTYPTLLRMAEDPQTRHLFATLAQQQPSWWESFFAYATTHSQNLPALADLYRFRQMHGGVPAAERKYYLDRLEISGHWREAYFVWLNSLEPAQLDALGYLYNGNFELPLSGEGFDWHALPLNGTEVALLPVDGQTGQALRVRFREPRERYTHLFQVLFLDAGDYRLTGQVRLDDLHTEQGLIWRLRCRDAQLTPLADSTPFASSSTWHTFTVDFTVPANCRPQELRLELLGHFTPEFMAYGAIWFDELAIRRRH